MSLFGGEPDNIKRRTNGTFNSRITTADPSKAITSFNAQQNREKQFKGNAYQPGATRQSWQDSDLFGNKMNSETTQR